MLRDVLIQFLLALFFSIVAVAQYGSVPTGSFPPDYNGDTFTGTVTAAEGDQLTLTYTKGSKTDTFVGKLGAGCSVPTNDKSDRKMTAADIPQGTVLTAFFNRNTRKIDGQKVKENLLIAIAFNVWNGEKIEKKKIWPCGP
jgi:hypothetical protein